MKNILKSIVVFLAFIVNAQAQQDTIPRIDTTLVTNTENARSVSRNGNYINMDLPGINLDGADFSPLDDTIRKLNDAGWDVKIVGYYGLNGSMDDNVYADLLQQITADKQVVVKFGISKSDIIKVEVDIRNSNLNESSISLLNSLLSTHLQKSFLNLNSHYVINNIAVSLGILLDPNLGFVDMGDDGNGNRTTGDKLPRVLLPEDGFYLTAFGLPIWLPKGTIATFWPDRTCAIQNDECISSTNKNSRGMLAYIEFNGSESYISMYKKDHNGDLLRALRNYKGLAFAGVSGKEAPGKDETVTVILGLSPKNGSCGNVGFEKANLTVDYEKKHGTYQGDYVGVDELRLVGLKLTKNPITGENELTSNNNTSPFNVKPDCPPVVKSVELLKALENSADWHAVVETEERFTSYYGIPYLVTFKLPNNGFLLYRTQTGTWYEKGNNTNSWVEIIITDENLAPKIKKFIEEKITTMQVYTIGSTVAFIALNVTVGVATGGSSIVATLAIETGLAAMEAGVVYMIERDEQKAKTTFFTGVIAGGIGTGLGVVGGKIMSNLQGDDILVEAAESGAKNFDQSTKTSIKQARAATEMADPVTDVVVKSEYGFVSLKDVKAYAKNVLKFTDEQLVRLGDDIMEATTKGKQSGLLGCVNPISLNDDRITYDERSVRKCDLSVWKALDEIAETNARKGFTATTEFKEAIQKRIDDMKIDVDADPDFLVKLKEFYTTKHRLPKDCNNTLPCTVTRVIDGKTYNVPMTKFGFPDFKEGMPNFLDNKVYKGFMDGSEEDYALAAKWFKKQHKDEVILSGNNIIIKQPNGEDLVYTMHHLEDGEGIVPVLQNLHTAMKNVTGESVAHTGGSTILQKFLKLKNFFTPAPF